MWTRNICTKTSVCASLAWCEPNFYLKAACSKMWIGKLKTWSFILGNPQLIFGKAWQSKSNPSFDFCAWGLSAQWSWGSSGGVGDCCSTSKDSAWWCLIKLENLFSVLLWNQSESSILVKGSDGWRVWPAYRGCSHEPRDHTTFSLVRLIFSHVVFLVFKPRW